MDVLATKKGTLSFTWDNKDKDTLQLPSATVTVLMMYEPDGTNAQKMVSISTSTQLGGVFQVSGGFYDTSTTVPSITGTWSLTGAKKVP